MSLPGSLLPLQNLSNFIHPALPVSFGLDTKRHRFIVHGVSARRSKRSHMG